MRGSMDRVTECTSAKFEGYSIDKFFFFLYFDLILFFFILVCSAIALMHPRDSWVARWQRIGK